MHSCAQFMSDTIDVVVISVGCCWPSSHFVWATDATPGSLPMP